MNKSYNQHGFLRYLARGWGVPIAIGVLGFLMLGVVHNLPRWYNQTIKWVNSSKDSATEKAALESRVNELYSAAVRLSKAQGGRTPQEKAEIESAVDKLWEKFYEPVRCPNNFGPYKSAIFEDPLQGITASPSDAEAPRVLFMGDRDKFLDYLVGFYTEREKSKGRVPLEAEVVRRMFEESLSVIDKSAMPVKYALSETIVTTSNPFRKRRYNSVAVYRDKWRIVVNDPELKPIDSIEITSLEVCSGVDKDTFKSIGKNTEFHNGEDVFFSYKVTYTSKGKRVKVSCGGIISKENGEVLTTKEDNIYTGTNNGLNGYISFGVNISNPPRHNTFTLQIRDLYGTAQATKTVQFKIIN